MKAGNIHTRKYTRHVAVGVLVLVCAISWYHAVAIYRAHTADIIFAVESIAREIALPYHIARLSLQERTEELPVPVYNVSLDTIDDTWGTARAAGRTHEGVDIFAERGTPVFSATTGYVIRKNIGTRGGVNVMTVGPGGLYYYYAHLERIASGIERGAYVTPDTILGFVGNSGNATNTPPHLHFGIYPREWDAINPYPLLSERWE